MTKHTLSDLQKLAETDPERIRVMVAEMMGCVEIADHGNGLFCKRPRPSDGELSIYPVPNYPCDLNVCAEFEAGLRGNDLERYQHHLERVVFRFTTDDDWSEGLGVSARTKPWHAKPLHRCIAFILTKHRS